MEKLAQCHASKADALDAMKHNNIEDEEKYGAKLNEEAEGLEEDAEKVSRAHFDCRKDSIDSFASHSSLMRPMLVTMTISMISSLMSSSPRSWRTPATTWKRTLPTWTMVTAPAPSAMLERRLSTRPRRLAMSRRTLARPSRCAPMRTDWIRRRRIWDAPSVRKIGRMRPNWLSRLLRTAESWIR